jgi:hypothetical protein
MDAEFCNTLAPFTTFGCIGAEKSIAECANEYGILQHHS